MEPRKWLKNQKNIKVILNDENLGFAKGCNIGVATSEKENNILFLNNDTVVTPHWIQFWCYHFNCYPTNQTEVYTPDANESMAAQRTATQVFGVDLH